jgi:hypothetical protein
VIPLGDRSGGDAPERCRERCSDYHLFLCHGFTSQFKTQKTLPA